MSENKPRIWWAYNGRLSNECQTHKESDSFKVVEKSALDDAMREIAVISKERDLFKSNYQKLYDKFNKRVKEAKVEASEEILQSEEFNSLMLKAECLHSCLSAILQNEEIECRADEDCDHCVAISALSDFDKNAAAFKAKFGGG